MRKIERLKREAKKSAVQRGHVMQQFTDTIQDSLSYSACSKCKSEAWVNADLSSNNEREIYGDAVAFECV